jgi:hypothetical protein
LIKSIRRLEAGNLSLDEITPVVAIPSEEEDGMIFEIRLGASSFDDGQKVPRKRLIASTRCSVRRGALRRETRLDHS